MGNDKTIKGGGRLTHMSAHRNGKYIQTTVLIPLSLRGFAIRESSKPLPGSMKPMGISAWIQKLIIEERARVAASGDK